MNRLKFKAKRREWLRRYIPAESLGTLTSLAAAWLIYLHTHSYIAATAGGWACEGVGFYGYFITLELTINKHLYRQHKWLKKLILTVKRSSANLLIEFLPAEIIDTLLIRPAAMYAGSRYIHPYPIGFLIGKFSADIFFYIIAIIAYEFKQYWRQSSKV